MTAMQFSLFDARPTAATVGMEPSVNARNAKRQLDTLRKQLATAQADLEAAMNASGLDLRFGQQSGGVLILGIRAVGLNLHDYSHWIALPTICDNAATFGSRSAIADRTSRRSAFNVKIRCRIHRMTFTG